MFELPPLPALSDEELAEILRRAMLDGLNHRFADGFLAGIAAEHLVNRMRLARLVVTREPDDPWRLTQ